MKHTMDCLLCYLFGLAPKFQPMEDSAKANEMRNPVSDLQQGKWRKKARTGTLYYDNQNNQNS